MDFFNYKNDELFAENISLTSISEKFGTPCYVYSRATLTRHFEAFQAAFGSHPHLICYSVKANSNIAILNLLARLGSGFDIVSVGELERVIAAGGDTKKVVFSGVGKRHDEIKRALEVGIKCFNVESESELKRINEVAKELSISAPISIRVNPDVDAKTHPYISTGLKDNKFGIDINIAEQVYIEANQMSNLDVVGIDCHIGSQLTETAPFLAALERLIILAEKLEQHNINIKHLDLGGGLGVRYKDETPPLPEEYIQKLLSYEPIQKYQIFIEPGRAISANAAVLLTKVEYLKENQGKHFAIIDAAMNDLIRPALYEAWQEIIPINKQSHADEHLYDIVGPVCETGDFLGKDRKLALSEGDLLAVRSSGAYGFTMSSNYNTRPRVAEILVDGNDVHIIRERETIPNLFANENLLPGS